MEFSLVASTAELDSRLGIDTVASYGGFLPTSRFSFSQDVGVNESSIFAALSFSYIANAQRIKNPVLRAEAAAIVNNSEVFTARFGDMFLQSVDSGGIFVGVWRIDCHDEITKTQIEAQLLGTSGAVPSLVDLDDLLHSIDSKPNVSISVNQYTEGGPALPFTGPFELAQHAGTWLAAINSDPHGNAVPTTYVASPLSVVSGPVPLNSADIINAQDVLGECYRERTHILDEINLYQAILHDPSRFTFTAPVTIADITAALVAANSDLDTVHSTASLAMTRPEKACFPAQFANFHGLKFPAAPIPHPMPELNP